MEFSNRLRVRSIRSTAYHPDVLVLLEASRYISSKSSLLLKGEILGLVLCVERVSHNFTFSSEIISVSNIITGKVVHSLCVTDKNGFAFLNGLSLSFHTEVRVSSVNNPSTDIGLVRVYTGFLFARLRRVA